MSARRPAKQLCSDMCMHVKKLSTVWDEGEAERVRPNNPSNSMYFHLLEWKESIVQGKLNGVREVSA